MGIVDKLSVAFLVVFSVIAEWDRLSGPTWIGMDTATAFFPWYTVLGEQLRGGHIPVWSPYQFSGAPFAADPESGWMYLPAMIAFTLLPLEAAIRAHLLFHIILASLSTYGLARALGSNPLGSLVAATVYAHSGFFEGHNVCCFAYADVAAWLPLMLLGAELAIHASSWRARVVFWGVGGLALSQILAAWIGQGAYYALLVLLSYVAFRCRLRRAFMLHVVGLVGFGTALAAAGLLPRLEYDLLSNLPGGYPSADVSLRATSLTSWGFIDGWDRMLLQPSFDYIGLPVLVLAVLAPLVAWRHAYVRFFAVLGVVVLVLARAQPTPLHALLSYLPGFEGIHARSPERVLLVFYLAPAVLSAATVTVLTSTLPWRRVSGMIGGLALIVVMLDLRAAWLAQSSDSLSGGGDYQFQRVDLASYYAPSSAAEWLVSRSDATPFRYFGYAGHVFGGPMPYTLRWMDPAIAALLVNNRATLAHVDDVQGYNPLHLARYDDFISTINGHTQNYHHADIWDTGLDSPLLDLLNVRYILTPAQLASDEVAPQTHRHLEPVFADDHVQILENPSALARAWIVHSAREVDPQLAAESLVADDFDPRREAVVESPVPLLGQPADPTQESVSITEYEPDRIQLHANAAAPGLLILSEVYYPAWHAYIDDQPTNVYAVDHALRGVALPAGTHSVTFRYESLALTAGLVITALASALLIVICLLAALLTPSMRPWSDRG